MPRNLPVRRPDFAVTHLRGLTRADLTFLIDNMPQPGRSYEEIARLLDALPNTLESMLSSDYVFQAIFDRRRTLLDISPFLLFNVLLRRSLAGPFSPLERKVINYLANLLALFVRADRVHRIEPHDRAVREYIVDLAAEAERGDTRRQFVTYAHIGNYSLYLAGLCHAWLEHRHRRRPIGERYLCDAGRSYFDRAARHALARQLGLDDVFLRLAMVFEHYRGALAHLARNYLPAS